MREILFKAKRIDNGEWVQGYLYIRKSGVFEISRYDEELEVERYTYEVVPNTICQFTGLTDKNGNKIWENDILRWHNNPNDLSRVAFGEFCVVDMGTLEKIDRVIGWHYKVIETDYISKCEPFNLPMPITSNYVKMGDIEVIGNIFDNPELKGGVK